MDARESRRREEIWRRDIPLSRVLKELLSEVIRRPYLMIPGALLLLGIWSFADERAFSSAPQNMPHRDKAVRNQVAEAPDLPGLTATTTDNTTPGNVAGFHPRPGLLVLFILPQGFEDGPTGDPPSDEGEGKDGIPIVNDPGTYDCTSSNGCVATRYEDGNRIDEVFRKGDYIQPSADGYLLLDTTGWQKRKRPKGWADFQGLAADFEWFG